MKMLGEQHEKANVKNSAIGGGGFHHIAMKVNKRHLHWDPVKERFEKDDEANAMLSRPQRKPYGFAG